MVLHPTEEIASVGGTPGLSPVGGLLLDGIVIAGLCWGIAKITRKALEEIGLVNHKP